MTRVKRRKTHPYNRRVGGALGILLKVVIRLLTQKGL